MTSILIHCGAADCSTSNDVRGMMEFEICEESVSTISEHCNVSIAFEYDRILELTMVDNGLGGFLLDARHLPVPQVKDYDAVASERPSSWADQFDLSSWGFLVARSHGERIGGAVIAFDSEGVQMLERRRDLAVLWDIRVAPTFRGQGVGASLFQAAEQWSVERKCSQLKIETQNTNYAACRFYMRQGCELGVINRLAYPDVPNEVQLLWYKDLSS